MIDILIGSITGFRRVSVRITLRSPCFFKFTKGLNSKILFSYTGFNAKVKGPYTQIGRKID